MIQVKVKKMFDDVTLPEYATPGSACFDIKAHRCTGGERNNAIYGTGLQFEIPENRVMLVFSRSGDGFKRDIRLANCTGIIDSDYRGELAVKLTYDNDKTLIRDLSGERIAQGMVIPYEQVKFVISEELSTTERGEGGFGSTGA
jgi:dUTP pyrophosphatase